jgi:hypothetical protein
MFFRSKDNAISEAPDVLRLFWNGELMFSRVTIPTSVFSLARCSIWSLAHEDVHIATRRSSWIHFTRYELRATALFWVGTHGAFALTVGRFSSAETAQYRLLDIRPKVGNGHSNLLRSKKVTTASRICK